MRESKRRLRRERRAAERAARKRERRARRSLAMLTSSALSLIPGLAERAAAQTPENGWSLEYAYSLYSESSIPASKISAGSTDRYDIDTHQFHLRAPIGTYVSLGLDVMHETMTGASPWFTEPGADGDPVVVMTGASIEDARTDVLGSVSLIGERSRTTFSGGASVEDDYRSVNVGFGREKDYNQKNSTISWGFGYSSDHIDPTTTSFNPNPIEHSKKAGAFSLGLSQVLNHYSVAQTSFTYQYEEGFLSDPYKLVSAGGVNRADQRPETRHQLAWLSRYRQHFERVHGSLHGDYRLYYNTWGVLSHTLELGWYQGLFERATLAPSVRYYTQSAAEFYAPFFAPTLTAGEDATSDYRLSPYGALSFKLRAELRLQQLLRVNWKLGLQWETYMSGSDLTLKKVALDNPGLVDFNVLMLTLQAGF